MKRNTVLFWLALSLAWITVILLFSTKAAVDSHGTSEALTQLLGRILAPDFASWPPAVQREWLTGMDQLVRKLAHVFEFAMLGVLAALTGRALLGRKRRKKPLTKMRLGLLCFYPCLAIAALDEVVQLSSAGRGASPADVLLDCAGILIGLVLCLSRCRMPSPDGRGRTPVRRRAR